uniref:Thaumatin-like protein n=1 Tax=Aegilops tauschii TaxID=37682 RepID=M8BV87_AEGTA
MQLQRQLRELPDCRLRRRAVVPAVRAAAREPFTIGNGQDFYDISVIDGFNVPLSFSCSNGPNLVCQADKCPDAYLSRTDDTKNHACNGNNNSYQVTFCP